MTSTEIDLDFGFPPRLQGFFDDPKRYYVLHGGRGSAKSRSVAGKLVRWSLLAKERILCCREIQKSIKQSVKRLLEDIIDSKHLRWLFDVKDQSITCRLTGSEFLFAGLWNNIDSIKSMEGVTICWVEEAQTVSPTSMDFLIPTVRVPGSFFIFTMNPRLSTDYVYENFIVPETLRPDAARIRLNWQDNPWFPDVLKVEMEWDRDNHPAKYRHVWLGELLVDDEALVFRGNVTSEWFETPDSAEFMFGADFGFARDPSTLVRTFMSPDEKTIFVDHEAGGVRVELDDHPALYYGIPESRSFPIIADSARPETISYLDGKGFCISGAVKGKGSVEDGIAFLQSKRIVVHPRCRETFQELKLHKYRRHHQTEEIMPKTEDANNHYIDALRYAWEAKWSKSGPMIKVLG